MSPIQWALRSLKRYFHFQGRAPRPEFWWFFVFYIVISLAARLVDRFMKLSGIGPYGWLYVIVGLALVIPFCSATTRRLHDIDRSGWWLLVAFVPQFLNGWRIGAAAHRGVDPSAGSMAVVFGAMSIIGTIILLIALCFPGTKGPNRHGPDPYEESDLEEVFA